MIVVSSTTVNDCAAVPAKVTADVPVKFVPVIVTFVPPAVGPLAGRIDVTAGKSVSEMAPSPPSKPAAPPFVAVE